MRALCVRVLELRWAWRGRAPNQIPGFRFQIPDSRTRGHDLTRGPTARKAWLTSYKLRPCIVSCPENTPSYHHSARDSPALRRNFHAMRVSQSDVTDCFGVAPTFRLANAGYVGKKRGHNETVLEQKFECKLHNPRAAGRAEYLPESGIRGSEIRQTESDIVEGIVELGAEL